MAEKFSKQVHTEHALLDIGEDVGALVIYACEEMHGQQIDVSLKGNDWQTTHTDVVERRSNGRPVFAALFPSLPVGEYTIWSDPIGSVTITGGMVAEVDWRNSNTTIVAPPLYAALRSGNTLSNMLPPRYQNGKKVSAAPMGTAPMRYDENGQVAWDKMWTDFCDLALAGGPPHRDSLLEPVPPDEIRADMEAYGRVVAEIERGFRLVTELPTVHSEKLGWVGLQCDNEEMALWLLRAIIVENVCVRREGTILFLPAGPHFRTEKELKNVITVVAKTSHYWIEHIRAYEAIGA